MENLIYTWVQIVHNFGAVAVVRQPRSGVVFIEGKSVGPPQARLVNGFRVAGSGGERDRVCSNQLYDERSASGGNRDSLGRVSSEGGLHIHRYGSYGILPGHAATLVRYAGVQDVADDVRDDDHRHHGRRLPQMVFVARLKPD
jgi:hypothetical protein